ncbi:MAG: autotransporter outer membrane beta-barrel domain-containing protein [Planctomycetaceae bacterium]|nr:autotransporter outer membrane beta-barrel domain-containing protein [Planctomycetaceae bacterium]
MQRNFRNSICGQAVIKISLLLLYLLVLTNITFGQYTPTPITNTINPTIVPYHHADPIYKDTAVVVELDGTNASISTDLTTTFPPSVIYENTYNENELIFNYDNNNYYSSSNFKFTNIDPYIIYAIGVLTNNSTVSIYSYDYPTDITVDQQVSGGFAGGLIYHSDTKFDGLIIGYDNSYNLEDLFNLNITSKGNAIGLGFLRGNNAGGNVTTYSDVSGYVYMGDINVESSEKGDAIGIIAGNITYYDTNPDESIISYKYGRIAANDITVSANEGNAIGISLTNIFKPDYDTSYYYYPYSSTPITIGEISATSAKGNAVGFQVEYNVGKGSNINFETITVEAGNNATGIFINNANDFVNIISEDLVVKSTDGAATGFWIINSIGNYADIEIVSDNTFLDQTTPVTVSSDNGTATGVKLGNIGTDSNINIAPYYYNNSPTILASSKTSDAIGLHITGNIGNNTNISSSSYYYDYDNGGYYYYNGGLVIESESESGDAIGALLDGTIGYADSYSTPNVNIRQITATSTTGGAIGMQVGAVSGTLFVDDIVATSKNTDKDVYGFILNGTILPKTDSSNGGNIVIGNITAEKLGGAGNVFGLVIKGEPAISGNLEVNDGITAKTGGTGSAIGVDLINGIKANSLTTGDNSVLQLNGEVEAIAEQGDAVGIRIGTMPIEIFVISNNVEATSNSGNAFGIYSIGGQNNISINTENSSQTPPNIKEFVQITGSTASIYFNGTDNKLIIGLADSSTKDDEIFTNGGETFAVYNAQEIIFNVKSELRDKSKFIGSESIEIYGDIKLSNVPNNESYFDQYTQKITIGKVTDTQKVEVDFGASQFRNRENTSGLILTTYGKGIFNYDQIFNGIIGNNGGIIDARADNGEKEINITFIGVGNFVFDGKLDADYVTVDKNYIKDDSNISLYQIETYKEIGTQSIGVLLTDILTIKSGTLKIVGSSVKSKSSYDTKVEDLLDADKITKIKGLQSGYDVNGKELAGSLIGIDTAAVIIDIDAGSNYYFGGLVDMGYIIKKGDGKQTIRQIESYNLLTINAGELEIIESAAIGGIRNDANADINSTFTVGGNLTLSIGIDEVINPSSSTTYYGYTLNEFTFIGNLNAGSITKEGKGIQRFNTVTTNVITFGQAEETINGEIEIDTANRDANGKLIDLGSLVGTETLPAAGELNVTQWAKLKGIEGNDGILSGGDFTIDARDNHSSTVTINVENLTKTGQGRQTLKQLRTQNLFIESGSIETSDDIVIENGIIGEQSGQIIGKNITISNNDNKDYTFLGNLKGYNVTKRGLGQQTFNKLETTNNLNLVEGQISVNQIRVDGTLSLEKNTTLDVLAGSESFINATDVIDGTILIHGPARANTVGIKFGGGVDRNKFRTSFIEEPDQFITWKLGANSVYAAANSQAHMSESYLTSLLLHDHNSAWNAVAKRLNQLSAAGAFFRNRYQADNQFFGQSPYSGKTDKSLWFNYIGRTGSHKSDFNNKDFKLRSDGIQVGYDIIPSQSFQYGLLFGYEGQSSTVNQDKVTADDTYIGFYITKLCVSGIDLRAMINYGHQIYNSTRYAKNVTGFHSASYKGDTVEGIIEVGKKYYWSKQLILRPVFALELYYNMINRAKEDDKFNTNTAVTYDLATLKQTLLRFGSDIQYEIRQLTLNSGLYYTFNCGTDKLTTIVVDDFGQRLPLNGSKLGRSIISANLGGQYYTNDLKTRSIFMNYSGNFYVDRKNSPITGTFHIGFQFDF